MKKELNSRFLPMNLQFFAEPGSDGSQIEPVPPAEPNTEPNGGKPNEPTPPEPPAEPGNKPKYTDDDVNRLINEKFAKWKAEQDKKQGEAKKYEEMSDLEKATYDRKKAQDERDALQQQLDKSNMLGTTRSLLNEAKLPVYDKVIDMATTNDAETTKANVDVLREWARQIQEDDRKQFLLGDKSHISGTKPNVKGSLGKQVAESQPNGSAIDNPYAQKVPGQI